MDQLLSESIAHAIAEINGLKDVPAGLRWLEQSLALGVQAESKIEELYEIVRNLSKELGHAVVPVDGTILIRRERLRQINEEGFTPEHDAAHQPGDLTDAACCYSVVASAQVLGASVEEWPVAMFNGFADSVVSWPWEDDWYKPSPCAVRNLVMAGALIAAAYVAAPSEPEGKVIAAARELYTEHMIWQTGDTTPDDAIRMSLAEENLHDALVELDKLKGGNHEA